MSSIGTVRTTPGVYVTEFSAFPPSIVGVATAIPIFVGYTEYATDPTNKKPVYMQAIELSSMADYYSYFGYGLNPQYDVVLSTIDDYDFQAPDASGTLQYYKVGNTLSVQFNMFTALKLFYANGGGRCYVVSVGNYAGVQSTQPFTGTPVAPKESVLESGLDVAHDQVGPTMLVVPDACLLTQLDYGTLTTYQLKQASQLQDRVAILDMWGALDPTTWSTDAFKTQAGAFYTEIGQSAAYVSYGTAYGPALQTSILTTNDVDYTNLSLPPVTGTNALQALLTEQAALIYNPGNLAAPHQPPNYVDVMAQITAAFATPVPPPSTVATIDQYLCNAIPLLAQIESIMVSKLNVAPPCGVMAGIWTANDANRGVWNAPANMSAVSVVAPKVMLTDGNQGDYNVPLNGYAINILRAFNNRGTVVWGARTLDGNSNDYRYIQVRRTLVYIEQSIKTALQPFVFAANVGTTWVTVTGMISNFLTSLWTQGGLMGDKASDAFTVQCGLGSTMTGLDVLNGYMIVAVTLQMVHPAEFIELTFTQKMQGV